MNNASTPASDRMVQTLSELDTLLYLEERATPIKNRAGYDATAVNRARIVRLLSTLERDIQSLRNRANLLKRLPNLAHVEWADAVSRLSGLAFLVVDTTGVTNDADLLRLYLINGEGTPLFHEVVTPGRWSGQTNEAYTGIKAEDLVGRPTLQEVWPNFLQAIGDRYILAYNLDFVRAILEENARHYGLELPPLIGDCLQTRVQQYYGAAYPIKLVDVCARIGRHIGTPAVANDRAQAQRAILHAMSQGITSVSPAPSQDDLDEDHPF